MITTIKITEETKNRLLKLDIAGKDKTFDMLINELVTSYEKKNSDYKKSLATWEKQQSEYTKLLNTHKTNTKEYEKEQKTWKKILKWAKSKGFKE